LRDAYNHIGALIFREKGISGMIALPVVDDGELVIGKNLYMDWEDPAFTPAPINAVLDFYKIYIGPKFTYYPGFVPAFVIKSEQSGQIEALQLRNRLYVPTGPPSSAEEAARLDTPKHVRIVREMEWSKNHEICLEESSSQLPNEAQRMSVLEFQEIFEHLRLTFSNWLASREDGGEFRKQLEHVIFSARLPLYEKRKRMEILLSPEMDNWITTEFADEDRPGATQASLLRADCRVKGQEQCNGRCVWAQSDMCLLHVPAETELGEDPKKVSAPRVLLLRLIEEILRYGERRRQLFEQDVPRLASIDKPVVLEGPGGHGKQVIYPEKSAAWYELLRLEWAKEESERPRFLEEMSRDKDTTPLAKQDLENKLPERLETLLNGPTPDPKTGAIRLFRAPFEALLTPLRLNARDIGVGADTQALTEDMLRRIVEQTGGRVFQIDLRQDPPALLARKPMRSVYEIPTIPIFVITPEGPGLLVLNPEAPELFTREEMPAGLITILDKTMAETRGILKLKVAAPQPKAVAAQPKAVAAQPKAVAPQPAAQAKAVAPQPAPQPLAEAPVAESKEGEAPPAPKPATKLKTLRQIKAERSAQVVPQIPIEPTEESQ
jgi:hypothetical protein